MSKDSRLQDVGNDTPMELDGLAKDFLAGKEELDRITSLHRKAPDHPSKKPKGGTSPMAPETREALAEHMRRYWANRKRV